MKGLSDQIPKALREKSSGKPVLKYKFNGKRNFYRLNDTGITDRIIQTKGIVKKMKADFYRTEQSSIDSITLSHYNIHMVIQLVPIKDTISHVEE
jgi:hypothetical protein